MEHADPYAVLGIAPGASVAEIRAAYSAILNRLKAGAALCPITLSLNSIDLKNHKIESNCARLL